MNSSTSAPAAKVIAATVGAAVAVILFWLLSNFGHIDVPENVQNAITILLTFAFGYITPPARRDVPVSKP